MRIIEIIVGGESTTYNADALIAVGKKSCNTSENYFWVSIKVYSLDTTQFLLANEAIAEKLYLSIKAFMKSDSDEELIIQLKKGCDGSCKLVAIQTIKK